MSELTAKSRSFGQRSSQSPKPYCHTFVSYFGVFQMSAVPLCLAYFSETGRITNFDLLFLVMGFISIIFMLISRRHFCQQGLLTNQSNQTPTNQPINWQPPNFHITYRMVHREKYALYCVVKQRSACDQKYRPFSAISTWRCSDSLVSLNYNLQFSCHNRFHGIMKLGKLTCDTSKHTKRLFCCLVNDLCTI